MNARAYYSILRPVRTLMIAILYGTIFGLNILKFLIRLDWSESLFLSLTVIAPLFLGFLLLGPIHEVMHRSFSATLPGVRMALLRWHVGAIAVAAVLLFIGARISSAPIPAAANFGYIFILLTIPLLNERKPTAWAMIFKAGGILTLYVFLLMPSRSLLLSLGNRFPWIVLFSGVAFAVFCFRRGFSERAVRERSRRRQMVFCYQSLALFPGAGFLDMTRYVQSENARALAVKKSDRMGRDWTTKVVGSSNLDWVRAIHHTRFGAASHARTVVSCFAIGFLPVFSVAMISFWLSRLSSVQTLGFGDFYASFVDSCRLGSVQGLPADTFFGMGPFFGVMLVTLAGAVGVGTSFAFPISRQRQAKCAYIEMLWLGALACFGYGAALFLSVGVACVFAGRSLELGFFGKPLLSLLVVPPLALINLAIFHFIARSRWFVSGAGFAFVLLFSVVGGIAPAVALGKHAPAWYLQRLDASHGAVVLFVWLLMVGLSLWLLKFAMSRHYRKCDLKNAVPWAKAFYPGT